jgi:hypothetical protein
LIESSPDDGPVRTETYVGVVLTKINSDIECASVGFLKNRVKMHGDDNIKSLQDVQVICYLSIQQIVVLSPV